MHSGLDGPDKVMCSCSGDMMTTALEQLDAEIALLQTWSDTDSRPISERGYEWELDYPGRDA